MEKVDLRKSLKDLYRLPKTNPVLVDIPPLKYLMIDGEGDPNTAESYRDAIGTLFPLSYGLKFLCKKGSLGVDYSVMPLEGLWWVDRMEEFTIHEKSAWKWTSMIMQPDFITSSMLEEVTTELKKKKKKLPSAGLVRLEGYEEGKSAQIMHIGPFSDEGPTIERLHAFIEQQGYRRRGKHHEIYLSDVRRVAPEKMKTIIRQPVS